MKKGIALVFFAWLSVVCVAQNGSVLSQRKISDTTANFTGVLASGVNFGSGVAAIGDLNGDGVTELVSGAYDVGGQGAVYTLFMNTNGSIDSFKLITEGAGGFTGTLGAGNRFGYSVAALGDLDLDGVPDVAVSSELDDDGGSDRGAVWILYLKADGTVKGYAKISSTTQGSLLATPAYGIGDLDRFGSEVECIGDLDNDGIQDIAVSAIFDDDGGGNRGAVWIIFLNRDGSIKGFQKISDTQGGFTGTLVNFTFWGSGVGNIGDLDGDGIQDLAIGQELEDAGGTDKGAVWVLFMNRNGSVKGYKELRNGLTGTGLPSMGDSGYFGSACAGLGDIDDDGIPDVAVGANGTDSQRGAVYILMLNTNGTVKAQQKISYNAGALAGPLDINDLFGNSITSLGDLNGDGKTDIAVGAAFDDDGGSDKGAVYILNLQGVATNCVNASFAAANNTVCQGDTLTFTNNSSGLGNVTYVWKVNGAVVSTSTNLQYTFNTPGTYSVRLTATNDAPACVDSIETTVVVAPASNGQQYITVCDGQSRFIAGAWRSASGTFYDTLLNAASCDSIVEITFEVRPIAITLILDTTTICQGQSYLGQTQTGIFGDTFIVAGLCQIDLHDLRVLPNSTSSTTQTICNGDSVFLGNAWRSTAGVYSDTLIAANTCDSIVSVTLSVLPNAASTQNVSICPGQSYFAGGANQTTAGTYYDTLVAANGCDSVLTTVLTVSAFAQNTITQTICFGDSYLGYNATGIYRDTFATSGCDSIRILNLTVRNAIATTFLVSICPGQSYFAGGANQTTAGTYYDTLVVANGCDSVVTTVLTLRAYAQNTIIQTICYGDSYLGYSATGIYRDTFATSGCDSIRILDLTVEAQNSTQLIRSICQGQSFEGYAATGIYADTFIAANGCDSIRIIDLTVSSAIQTTDNQTICYGDSYLGYNTSGVYSDTMVAAAGCDSIHTINLTVLPQNLNVVSPAICQGQSFEGYDTTGIYIDTLTDINGCDSIRTIRLTVRPAIELIVSQTICTGDSFEGYTTAGTYSDTLSTAGGCDSIYTLILTVEPNPVAPAISANGNNLSVPDTFATYQWYQDGNLLAGAEADTLIATSNGNYAVVVSNAAGCSDTSAVVTVTGVGIGEVANDLGLLVYPNPTQGFVTLSFGNNASAEYALYNSLGQLLKTGIIIGNGTLDMQAYNQGLYYLKVQARGVVITQKIILAR